MEIRTEAAALLVGQFEELLAKYDISVPQHAETEADMLPLWRILKDIKNGLKSNSEDFQQDFVAALAVHDMAAKVLKASTSTHFGELLPHLKMLAGGAVHLTEAPPAYADVYNKLIELYWAALCLSKGIRVSLDHPEKATGANPDVVTLDDRGDQRHAYAFKTVRSAHTQSILDHLIKGIDQIEKSASPEGIVALHLTPRLQNSSLWPGGLEFPSWEVACLTVTQTIQAMIAKVVADNGEDAIKRLFAEKKTVPAVLCVAFFPIVAPHPETGTRVFMPLKLAMIVNLLSDGEPSAGMMEEIKALHHAMQTVL